MRRGASAPPSRPPTSLRSCSPSWSVSSQPLSCQRAHCALAERVAGAPLWHRRRRHDVPTCTAMPHAAVPPPLPPPCGPIPRRRLELVRHSAQQRGAVGLHLERARRGRQVHGPHPQPVDAQGGRAAGSLQPRRAPAGHAAVAAGHAGLSAGMLRLLLSQRRSPPSPTFAPCPSAAAGAQERRHHGRRLHDSGSHWQRLPRGIRPSGARGLQQGVSDGWHLEESAAHLLLCPVRLAAWPMPQAAAAPLPHPHSAPAALLHAAPAARSTPQQLSSVSLCFSPIDYSLTDCSIAWKGCEGGQVQGGRGSMGGCTRLPAP